MINKNFILHLTLIENIGPSIIQRIIQRSDVNPSDLYSFSQADWIHSFGFSEGTSEKLVDGLANTKALETELALIQEHNVEWITFAEETYPHMLKNIYLPPAVLYVMGNSLQSYEKQKLLAVVGARKADDYGQHVIDALIPDLVAADYTIVSGGALGIDAMAHAATLKSSGKTIAVLGSGLLHWYPTSNQKLFASIVAQGGTLVSSFPLLMQALPGNFPARNRIVTGLSRGCVVIQAAQKSGALISADYAMEQGREVFAVPGPVGNELSAGCNALIQKGAKLVTCAADILEEFGDRVVLPDKKVMQEKAMQMSLESFPRARPEPVQPHLQFLPTGAPDWNEVKIGDKGYLRALKDSLQQVQTERKRVDKSDDSKYSNYSEQQKLIITACKQLISFDDIIIKTQLSSALVQSELFNLQLDGVIAQDFTGMWIVQ